MEYKIGTNYNGFVLVREENIKEVNSIARIFEHEKQVQDFYIWKMMILIKYFQ